MNRLIKAELKKILHKKSFYIVTILFILYALLTNVIYKDYNKYDLNSERLIATETEKHIKNLDPNNSDDLPRYVSDLTTIEVSKFDAKITTSNGLYLSHEYLEPLIAEINENKYIHKNEEKVQELELLKKEIITKIENDDYKYFVNNKIKNLKEKLNTTLDKETRERTEIYLKLAEYRLNNSISYDTRNYLSNALGSLTTDLAEYRNLKNKGNLTKSEKERLEKLTDEFLTNKYILENQQDLYQEGTIRAVLMNFNNEFQIFILIYIVMICGSIVSEEFNKGTIKYLLTKPYKRSTILTSKLLTVLILIPIIILSMILIEIIMGGIMLGFDSLSIPVVIYNASKSVLVEYSCFNYLFMMLLASAPMYLILSILCFSLSTLTNSTSAAITITFLFYLVSEVLRALVLTHNIALLKAFVSVHWDFTYLINYQENPFNFKPIISLSVVLGYISVILCLTYLYFSKKDVKNI